MASAVGLSRLRQLPIQFLYDSSRAPFPQSDYPLNCIIGEDGGGLADKALPSPVPKCEGVKCRDILYILSPDILYTCCQPVKRRQALLESNLAEE
jgi:hypothetical protein